MRTYICATIAALACAGAARAQPYTEAETRALALRAAQADALHRLTDRVLAARLAPDRTVAEALGGGQAEIDLRVFLRAARIIGDPRTYSDGLTEVDVELPLADLAAQVCRLAGLPPDEPPALEELRAAAVEGLLRESGRGRPPQDVPPEVLLRAMELPREALPELFPLGWEDVAAAGRVQAARDARIRAYQVMSDRLRALRVTPAATVGQKVALSRAAEARLDAFIRSLPVKGRARMMPDRVAEVDVAAPVAALIEVLKKIELLLPPEHQSPPDEIDHLSVRLKAAEVPVTGRGMPAPPFLRPAAHPPAAGAALPDWAARVLEARGEATLPEQIEDPEQARLLAARSAKASAMQALARQVDEMALDDGRTVRERAAKDEVFRQDVRTFLESARTTVSRPADADRWEVVVRLPLLRLYEFSRRAE